MRAKSEAGRHVRLTCTVFLSVLFAFIFTACDSANNVSVGLNVPGSSISGQFDYKALVNSASASACTAPKAHLYSLSASGQMATSPVGSTQISSSGSYTFRTKPLGIQTSSTTVIGAYVVVVEGCANGVYMRPITSTDDQDITSASTLVAYMMNSSAKANFANALKSSPLAVSALVNQLGKVLTTEAAFNKLSTDSKLSAHFNAVFSSPPSILQDAAPHAETVTWPSTIKETEPFQFAVSTSHWSSKYSRAFEWSVDGVVVSNSASGNSVLSANSQGDHVLRLKIGESDGSSHVDITKPVVEFTKTIAVSNTVLPTAPHFHVSVPTVSGTVPIATRALTVTVDTGASLQNCDSFSKLALTESAVAPTSPASFNLTCSSTGTQDIPYVLISPNDGLKKLFLWTMDSAGIVSPAASEFSFYLDATIPAVTITTVPVAVNNFTTQAIAFSGTDNGGTIAGYECKLDLGAWSACSSPISLTSLSEGDHSFSVRAIDYAGNISNLEVRSWRTDLSAPSLTVTSQPQTVTNQLTSSFAFSAVDSGGGTVASYLCSVDGAAYQNCVSPTIQVLMAGNHSVSIKAQDTAGNVSSIYSYSWLIDSTAPTATYSSKPPVLTNSQSAAFAFSGTDLGGAGIGSFTCALDSAPPAPCTSPSLYSSLSAGSHSLTVRAIDNAGNIGTSTSWVWVIDTTTPMASISAQPDSLTNLQAASFTFSATAPPAGSITDYECKLDAGSYTSCASPFSVSALAQGAHTFSVRSIDNNGNASDPASYTWTIDITKPVAVISSQPNSTNNSTTGQFTFTATDSGGAVVSGFECSIDSSAFSSCSSPKTYSGLIDGAHSFSVRALDSAGNVSNSQSGSWTVDLVAPVASITSQPAAITNLQAADFTFTGSDVGGISGFLCALDNASLSVCTSPFQLSGLSAGSHTLSVKASDTAGNISSAVSYAWTVDLIAPTLSILSSPTALSNSTSASLTFAASDTGGGSVASTSCQLDGGGFAACSSPKLYTGLSSGAHTVNVKASDSAGNVSSVASASWTVDVTPPTVTISSPSTNGTTIQTSALSTFSMSGSCSENGILVNLSGSLNGTAACTSGSWTYPSDLSALTDGMLSVTVNQTDSAGNMVASPPSRTFKKDATPPTLTLTQPPAVPGGTTQTLSWSAADTGGFNSSPVKIELSLDSGSTFQTLAAATANTGSYSWAVPAATNVTTARIRLTAIDSAGNVTVKTSSNFVIDSAKPVLSSLNVTGPSSVTSNNIPINFSANDNLKITHFCFLYNNTVTPATSDPCWISVTNAGATAATSVNVSNYYFRIGFTAANYVISGFIKDEAGNISSLTQTSGVDTATVTYVPGSPPRMVTVLAVANDSPSVPPSASDSTVAAGSTVYVYWQASDSHPLPVTAIDLAYTTNDTTWTSLATGLPNAQGSGCTLSGSFTGCYKWTNGSPTSSYFKIQAKVTNDASFTAVNSSSAVNATSIRVLAGNTDIGIGASATAAVFLPRIGSVLVHPNGTIFFRDPTNGILKVDPSTGLTTVFMRVTGTASGDGGPVTSATLKLPMHMTFDRDNNLLVIDNNRIRRINLAANPPTVTTLIGGGANTSATVANATDVSIALGSAVGSDVGIFPLLNGDILFHSESASAFGATPRLRWYKASDGSVTSIYFTGSGLFTGNGATVDVSTCTTGNYFIPLLDTSGTLTGFLGSIQSVSNGSTCSWDGSYHYAIGKFGIVGALQSAVSQTAMSNPVLGRDGVIYDFRKGIASSVFRKFDPNSQTWTNIGTTGITPIPDGASLSALQNTFDDVFIDLNGKYYFAENGAIRAVSDAGKLLTIAGQSLNYGEGLPATQARFGLIRAVGLWNDGSQDKLITLDTLEHYIREIGLSASGVVNAIAGTGAYGTPSTSSLAVSQPIYDVNVNGSTAQNFAVDSSGNVVMSSASQIVGQLNRISGKWVTVAGGGSTYYATAADNVQGTSVKYLSHNSVVQIAGIGNGKVVLGLVNYGSGYTDPALKLLDTTTWQQSSLTSSVGTTVTGSFSPSGTALNACLVPDTETTPVTMAYDAATGAWYSNNSSTIQKLVPGGSITTYITGLSVAGMAYNRIDAANEMFYICRTNGVMQKIPVVNGVAGTPVNLNWPIASMTCTGRSLIYSQSRASLVFAFKQNGMYGIAEYIDP
jgi:large repetitive protein